MSDQSKVAKNNKNMYKSGAYFKMVRKRQIMDQEIYKIAYKMIVSLDKKCYQKIFEIGSGPGTFLDYLSKNIDDKDIYGFDIFSNTINDNKIIYKNNKKIQWVYHDNLPNYLNTTKIYLENTFFIALWVLENIPPTDLYKFFDSLKNIKNIYFFFCSTTVNSKYIKDKYEIRPTKTHFEYDYKKILDDYNFKILDIFESCPKNY